MNGWRRRAAQEAEAKAQKALDRVVAALQMYRRAGMVTVSIEDVLALLGAEPEALEELAARSLALFRLREMHAKPEMIRLVIGGAEDFLRLWRKCGHALATARAGTHQDQSPYQVGRLKGDFLRDKAADRKAERIDFRQS